MARRKNKELLKFVEEIGGEEAKEVIKALEEQGLLDKIKEKIRVEIY